jgi:hypothetical protein
MRNMFVMLLLCAGALFSCTQEEIQPNTSTGVLNNPDNDWVEGIYDVGGTVYLFDDEDPCNGWDPQGSGYHYIEITEDEVTFYNSEFSSIWFTRNYEYLDDTSYGVPVLKLYEEGSTTELSGDNYYLYTCNDGEVHFRKGGSANTWKGEVYN